LLHPKLLIHLTAVGVLLLGLAGPPRAAAEQPMAVLREKVSRGLSILNDPRYRSAAGRAVQGDRIWALSRETFDFAVMSRLVLASHWQAFTPEQQTAFIEAFAAFLRRAYLPDLLAQYNGEQLEYVREVMLAAGRARVDVLVHWRDRRIPVTAKMIRRRGTWKIYDVSSLGISAMQNYRAQFQWLLRRETPARVIDILNRSHGRSVDG
jgi:phospholipid transport system substrate-binding protein